MIENLFARWIKSLCRVKLLITIYMKFIKIRY